MEARLSEDLVRVVDLGKTYADGTVALRDITFSVKQGSVFGLIGPNGAGKSTCIRILTTLSRPTSGEVSVAGLNPTTDPTGVRAAIGVALQGSALDGAQSVVNILQLHALLQGLPRSATSSSIEAALEMAGLVDERDKKIRTLSGGMLRRLDLAVAMLHDPPIIFLDEPSTGLDPEHREAIWMLLARLKGDGKAIVLTSQYLEEVDRLCDHATLIADGRNVLEGSPADLKLRVADMAVVFTPGRDRRREMSESLARIGAVVHVRQTDQGVRVLVRLGSAGLPAVLSEVRELTGPLPEMRTEELTLDDVYLSSLKPSS